VADADFGNCGQDYDLDWPLHPIISRASLLGMGLALGQMIGQTDMLHIANACL